MLFLIRHGQTLWNSERRLQGHLDSALTDEGVRQCRAFGNRLKDALAELPDPHLHAVTSPLPRARHTAALLGSTLGRTLNWHEDPRLREHAYGMWEGLTWTEIRARHGAQHAARDKDRWRYVIPGGESLSDVWQRASDWLAELPRDQVVIAVTHSTTSRAIRLAYLDLPPQDLMSLEHHTQDRMFRLADGRVEALHCTTAAQNL